MASVAMATMARRTTMRMVGRPSGGLGVVFPTAIWVPSLVVPAVHTTMVFRTMGGSTKWQRHKRRLKLAKGFYGKRKNCYSIAIKALYKAWMHAYRHRRTRKRDYRRLWIQKLTAGSRQYQLRYSQLIRRLYLSNIQLNRKVLADLAATEPFAFKAVLDVLDVRQRMHEEKMRETRENGQLPETEEGAEEAA